MTLLFTGFLRVQPREVLGSTEWGDPHISGNVQSCRVGPETYSFSHLLPEWETVNQQEQNACVELRK